MPDLTVFTCEHCNATGTSVALRQRAETTRFLCADCGAQWSFVAACRRCGMLNNTNGSRVPMYPELTGPDQSPYICDRCHPDVIRQLADGIHARVQTQTISSCQHCGAARLGRPRSMLMLGTAIPYLCDVCATAELVIRQAYVGLPNVCERCLGAYYRTLDDMHQLYDTSGSTHETVCPHCRGCMPVMVAPLGRCCRCGNEAARERPELNYRSRQTCWFCDTCAELAHRNMRYIVTYQVDRSQRPYRLMDGVMSTQTNTLNETIDLRHQDNHTGHYHTLVQPAPILTVPVEDNLDDELLEPVEDGLVATISAPRKRRGRGIKGIVQSEQRGTETVKGDETLEARLMLDSTFTLILELDAAGAYTLRLTAANKNWVHTLASSNIVHDAAQVDSRIHP